MFLVVWFASVAKVVGPAAATDTSGVRYANVCPMACEGLPQSQDGPVI